MKNLFNIKDKVVVITGGTGVLGKAIALHLAEEGAKVVILGRKAEVGNAIVNEIKTNGGEALFLTTDVMNREILDRCGRPFRRGEILSYQFSSGRSGDGNR